MKHAYTFYACKSSLLFAIFIIMNHVAMSQVPPDTTKPKVDTVAPMPMDTAKPAQTTTTPPATTATSTNQAAEKPKHFSIYAGVNSNSMSGSTEKYNANSGVGYHIGVAWEKGSFLYWQVGLRYNSAVYGFNSKLTSKDTGDLKVQTLDVPLTFGVNFLSFAKIVSLRGYISAMPSFTLGVSDNHFNVQKSDVNSFIFYGQVGIGASIAFLLVDFGYNYGFSSLMKNSVSSTNPGQLYLSLGVRF